MITRITGLLNKVLDEELRLQVGPMEYGILIPESVRRVVQQQIGSEITLRTLHYLEGGQNSNKFLPRLVGFMSEEDYEFFELFCTVDKIGIKKALRAMSSPVKEIAAAISRQDSKWLSTLPGIGKSSADQIIATLKTKVTKYTFMTDAATTVAGGTIKVDPTLIEETYQALVAIGMNPQEARMRLDNVLSTGKEFKDVQSLITEATRFSK